MKWIVLREMHGAPVYWNEKAGEWTVNRMKATEFTTYQEANLVKDAEGGWLKECTTIAQPGYELNTK